MNLTWDTFANLVDQFLDFLKKLLTRFAEWPLIEVKD